MRRWARHRRRSLIGEPVNGAVVTRFLHEQACQIDYHYKYMTGGVEFSLGGGLQVEAVFRDHVRATANLFGTQGNWLLLSRDLPYGAKVSNCDCTVLGIRLFPSTLAVQSCDRRDINWRTWPRSAC